MLRSYSLMLVACLPVAAIASPAVAQLPRIGIIDLYGLHKTTPAEVREALGVSVGDTLTSLALFEVPARLAGIPTVASAAIHPVCCEDGKTMLYVGIAEEGAPTLELRPPPTGQVQLPEIILRAGAAFEQAHMRAVLRGFVKEDVSQGHSLMSDSVARSIQLAFIPLASQFHDTLRAVLRTSADQDQRALAAEVIAYDSSKARVVDDLVYAMRDPSSDVRNNATRALALIAMYARAHPELHITVPYEPFIDLLNSLAWTDRNKASLALMALTESRDPTLLKALHARAFDALAEMARWKSEGHAMAGALILGRMAGMPDEQIVATYERGEAEKIIAAAK